MVRKSSLSLNQLYLHPCFIAAMSDSEYSTQEKQRVARLQEILNSSKSSELEQQIAEAELNDMHIAKGGYNFGLPFVGISCYDSKHSLTSIEREPHTSKYSGSGSSNEQGGSDDNIFHNDEAFERFEMGGNQKKKSSGRHSGPEERAANDFRSVKMSEHLLSHVSQFQEDSSKSIRPQDSRYDEEAGRR